MMDPTWTPCQDRDAVSWLNGRLRHGTLATVPGPEPVKLTASQRRALERATRDLEALERDLEERRRRWAALVRSLGISACARELGVSRQALRERVVRIERRSPKIPPRRARTGVRGRS